LVQISKFTGQKKRLLVTLWSQEDLSSPLGKDRDTCASAPAELRGFEKSSGERDLFFKHAPGLILRSGNAL